MSRIRYAVAMSLDGYIAGPAGEVDWIIADPEIDFRALFAQFDTFVMGRRTFERMAAAGGLPMPAGTTFVFSRSLRPQDHPGVTILADLSRAAAERIRAQATKDVWLFGGGLLFRSFLDAGLVDSVEVAGIPVLLGGGLPMLPHPAHQAKLTLSGHRVYPAGIVSLEYAVTQAAVDGLSRVKPRGPS